MLFNFKSVVHFLKLVTYLLLSRSFDNIIHDIAEKYEHIELKMTENCGNMFFNFKSVVHFLKFVTYLLLYAQVSPLIG